MEREFYTVDQTMQNQCNSVRKLDFYPGSSLCFHACLSEALNMYQFALCALCMHNYFLHVMMFISRFKKSYHSSLL